MNPNAPDDPCYSAEERNAFDVYAAAYISAMLTPQTPSGSGEEIVTLATQFALGMLAIRRSTFGYKIPTVAKEGELNP